MPARDVIVDFSEFDENHIVADIEEIRRYNPQRFEMEQLTAIVFQDEKRMGCVGYKDVRHDEFWVRGHMPGLPLMPGVLICEAAAQLCSYYALRYNLMRTDSMIGFGGMEDVRFRGVVRPGDRLILMAGLLKVRPGAMVVARFQGYVNRELVAEGIARGIPLPADIMRKPPVKSEPLPGTRQA
ncbi:MAG: beta-hydroxyacyl-ACP dehydratase [Planctomycetia bacterium]|nr:beta-hydroxyacyl-ACP dehydratase [Planctomycetia bacterium]